jgi:hypothetical protein
VAHREPKSLAQLERYLTDKETGSNRTDIILQRFRDKMRTMQTRTLAEQHAAALTLFKQVKDAQYNAMAMGNNPNPNAHANQPDIGVGDAPFGPPVPPGQGADPFGVPNVVGADVGGNAVGNPVVANAGQKMSRNQRKALARRGVVANPNLQGGGAINVPNPPVAQNPVVGQNPAVVNYGAQGGGAPKAKAKAVAQKRIVGACWNCGKIGHRAEDCRQPKRETTISGGQGFGGNNQKGGGRTVVANAGQVVGSHQAQPIAGAPGGGQNVVVANAGVQQDNPDTRPGRNSQTGGSSGSGSQQAQQGVVQGHTNLLGNGSDLGGYQYVSDWSY